MSHPNINRIVALMKKSEFATWDPATKGSSVTLSNGNLTAVSSSNLNTDTNIKSTISKSSGKWYWEITMQCNSANSVILGDANSSWVMTSGVPGFDTNGQGYRSDNGQQFYSSASTAFGVSFTSGDVIGLALDASNGNLQIRKNNSLQGTLTNAVSGPYFAAASVRTSGSQITANFGATALTYAPPAGYNAGLY